METSTYEINSRENFYLGLRALFSLGFYYFIAVFFVLNDNPLFAPIKGIIYVYVAVIIFLVLLQSGLMIGYLKGNGILLGEHQFPAVYNTVTAQAEALGISKVPDVYLVQAGGLLNAFATRFSGRNYIVIYSDLFEAAYEQNKAAVDFVLAHELGHIKRNHMLKNLLTFPAFLVPFLGTAYSRACEYTCDSIGHALSPNGAKNGLLLLAAGKRLYSEVNLSAYIDQAEEQSGFWYWFAEKLSTHPHLIKRLKKMGLVVSTINTDSQSGLIDEPIETEQKMILSNDDHSRFLPS